jgi:hypothetical protein
VTLDANNNNNNNNNNRRRRRRRRNVDTAKCQSKVMMMCEKSWWENKQEL